jgi:hypothetical protein
MIRVIIGLVSLGLVVLVTRSVLYPARFGVDVEPFHRMGNRFSSERKRATPKAVSA